MFESDFLYVSILLGYLCLELLTLFVGYPLGVVVYDMF